METPRHIRISWISLLLAGLLLGCGAYNFTGGDVGTAETFQVNYFQNYASQSPGSTFDPGLDRDFTLALQDLIAMDAFSRAILVIATPTGTGWIDNSAALYYNPAGLPRLDYQELSAMHMSLMEGTMYNYAAWAYPTPTLGGFGLSAEETDHEHARLAHRHGTVAELERELEEELAEIIATDIETENGVIHLIDGVLLENLDVVDQPVVNGFGCHGESENVLGTMSSVTPVSERSMRTFTPVSVRTWSA